MFNPEEIAFYIGITGALISVGGVLIMAINLAHIKKLTDLEIYVAGQVYEHYRRLNAENDLVCLEKQIDEKGFGGPLFEKYKAILVKVLEALRLSESEVLKGALRQSTMRDRILLISVIKKTCQHLKAGEERSSPDHLAENDAHPNINIHPG